MTQAVQLDERRTNTEPGADRGPRAGSPRGVVVRPGPSLAAVNIEWYKSTGFSGSRTFESKLSMSHRATGRYSSRFRICAAFVELNCLILILKVELCAGCLKLNQYSQLVVPQFESLTTRNFWNSAVLHCVNLFAKRE